jgi:hypothetical protein
MKRNHVLDFEFEIYGEGSSLARNGPLITKGVGAATTDINPNTHGDYGLDPEGIIDKFLIKYYDLKKDHKIFLWIHGWSNGIINRDSLIYHMLLWGNP